MANREIRVVFREEADEPANPPFTGSLTLCGYDSKGRKWWKQVLWYLHHPRVALARITGKESD